MYGNSDRLRAELEDRCEKVLVMLSDRLNSSPPPSRCAPGALHNSAGVRRSIGVEKPIVDHGTLSHIANSQCFDRPIGEAQVFRRKTRCILAKELSEIEER